MPGHPTLARPPGAAFGPARGATRVQFFCLGAAFGTWGVHVPSAKLHYALGDVGLAFALFAAGVGAVLALFRAGAIVGRVGARAACVGSGSVVCATLALLLATPAYALLLLWLTLFGAAGAIFDVAINTEGSALEAEGGRKVMSGFHAMFSVGGMAAAGVGAWLLRHGVAAPVHLGVAGGVLAMAIGIASRSMLPTAPPEPVALGGGSRPRGVLLLLGLLAAAGMLAEGAMYDWSVLYLHLELGAPQSAAALGYASFTGAMAAGRFGGDALRARFSAARLLGASAALAAVAMAAVLLVADPRLALLGFALVGLGLANVVPILLAGATRVPGVAPAAAIATVSALGYAGFLCGPPLVGALAEATSLTVALGLVVAASAVLGWGARRVA